LAKCAAAVIAVTTAMTALLLQKLGSLEPLWITLTITRTIRCIAVA